MADIRQTLESTILQDGRNLFELSSEQPILMVFLRHFGCTFCREALSDLADCRKTLKSRGVQLLLVHMAQNEEAREFFSRYEMDSCLIHADPSGFLYQAFGLTQGSKMQLFGLKVWARGFASGMLKGHGLGLARQDPFQMPGVFLVYKGRILSGYRHQSVADRPDYLQLSQIDQSKI